MGKYILGLEAADVLLPPSPSLHVEQSSVNAEKSYFANNISFVT